MLIVKASYRNENQKAKQLRKSGIVPGCVYGGGLKSPVNIQIIYDEVKKLLKSKSKDGKVTLEIEGKKITALLREICTDPVRSQIEHLSFQSLTGDETVSSTAQIVLMNKEIVSGYVQQNLFDISYRAFPSKLIEKIEINLDGLRAGTCMRVKDLDIAKNEDIELLTSADSLVFSIIENKRISYM
jgi:large subunit ribosomal protein L25